LFVFKMKARKKTKFDRLIIKNLKSLQDLEKKDEFNVWMMNYKNQLAELKQDPFEKKIFDYCKFESWFTSKIENRSYSEVVSENMAV